VQNPCSKLAQDGADQVVVVCDWLSESDSRVVWLTAGRAVAPLITSGNGLSLGAVLQDQPVKHTTM
jgi:hypothetical protein